MHLASEGKLHIFSNVYKNDDYEVKEDHVHFLIKVIITNACLYTKINITQMMRRIS
jgi:hypothetical protein